MAERRPASLIPAPLARLAAFALLAAVGVLEWARMAEDITALRALSWVLAGLVAAGGILLVERAPLRWQASAWTAAACGGIGLAFGVSGIELNLLKPARWDELVEGITRGAEALGGARLPYAGSDPWPADTLGLAAALLCCLGAMLAVWPRGGGRTGHPGMSLFALLVLVGSPVVSLGGPRPLMLGVAVAGLTACFLWLERVPLRPGLGAVVLGLAACAVALPLGTAADREEPWFDYRAFAEGIGPVDPVRYGWDHDYGPIDWPREGAELFRVRASRPFYWKAVTLDDFDGDIWRERRRARPFESDDPEDDLPRDWRTRPAWNAEFEVSLRRLRTADVVGAGTILAVDDARGRVRPELVPGRWVARPELRRGDSYGVRAHVPQPTPGQLAGATVGRDPRRRSHLRIDVDLRAADLEAPAGAPVDPFTGEPREPGTAEIAFAPFEDRGARPRASYRQFGVSGPGEVVLEASPFAGTWAVARRLRDDAESAHAYVLAVNDYLRDGAFRYTETPPRPTAGVAALEHFVTAGRAGFCQHFSGAMALMLRMGGVPARVVTGFSPGGFRRKRGDWIVRDTDAHSWVEAWFDDVGWVTFDPTPPATPARSQVAAIEPADGSDDPDEAATGTGSTAPLDPRLARQLREREGRPQAAAGDAEGGGGGGGVPWLIVALGSAALTVPAVWSWRRRRAAPGSPRRPADAALAELEAALRRCGRPAPAGTTLAQLERRLGTSGEASAYLRALRAQRYGVDPRPPSPSERGAFRRELATGLGWRGVLLSWWALPPRLRFPSRPR